MPACSTLRITLTTEERRELEARIRSTTLPAGIVKRSRIVLLRADSLSVSRIAILVGIQRKHAEKWLKRFIQQRLDGLNDKPGRGRKPTFSPAGCGSPRQNGLRAA